MRHFGFCLAVLSILGLAASRAAAQNASGSDKLVLQGYEETLRLMERGECDRARLRLIPNEPVAGDEVAMSDLGQCYIRASAKATDPDAAQRMREIGAGWVLRAAESGLRDAQEEAVRLFLDGKVFFVDPYEAGKWFLLWNANRSQIQLGNLEFDRDLQKLMDSIVTQAHWPEAKARASAFRPTILPQPRDAP